MRVGYMCIDVRADTCVDTCPYMRVDMLVPVLEVAHLLLLEVGHAHVDGTTGALVLLLP